MRGETASYFACSYLYRCDNGCLSKTGRGKSPKTFSVLNPQVLASLPEFVAMQFPAWLGKKLGLDLGDVRSMIPRLSNGGSIEAEARHLKERDADLCKEAETMYERLSFQFWQAFEPTIASDGTVIQKPLIETWDAKNWMGNVPTREYFGVTFHMGRSVDDARQENTFKRPSFAFVRGMRSVWMPIRSSSTFTDPSSSLWTTPTR